MTSQHRIIFWPSILQAKLIVDIGIIAVAAVVQVHVVLVALGLIRLKALGLHGEAGQTLLKDLLKKVDAKVIRFETKKLSFTYIIVEDEATVEDALALALSRSVAACEAGILKLSCDLG